jgi:uncharacterized protein (DUF1697 family)
MQPCRYVAFLRAVNVGGRVVKMTALKAIFESMKFGEVETFIASGNVIFTSKLAAARLEAQIEKRLDEALGYPVTTFLRTVNEISAVAERNPFGRPIPPGGRMYIAFLRGQPMSSVRQKVAALSTPSDEFTVHGRELYWLCAVPSLKSIMSGTTLEKVLGQPATLRNVNTVRRLAEKCALPAP